MSYGIKVYVVDYGRRCLMMRYVDPVSGKQRSKSAQTKIYKEALKAAARWEAELNAKGPSGVSRISWEDFRLAFELESVAGLAHKSASSYATSLNAFERLTGIRYARSATTDLVSQFVVALRAEGKSESSIDSYLKHLKAALRWAHGKHMLASVPAFPTIKRAKYRKIMKGRPITSEEFERILSVIPAVIDNATAARAWKLLWEGLWWSGLRLAEAVNLVWNPTSGVTDPIFLDIESRYPTFIIPAESEKGFTDRILPMAPEFAQFLQETEDLTRKGRVFRMPGSRGHSVKSVDYISRVGASFGAKAGVVVDDRDGSGKNIKYASAHDLRRSFGARWAKRVMPAVLRDMMRHADIDTTMKYYVGQNAQATGEAIWAACEKCQLEYLGNKPGNSETETEKTR